MAYVSRALEPHLLELTRRFPAVLVTGPRQSGKSTLLREVARQCFGDRVTTVSFDTPSDVDQFRRDPGLFFMNRPGPLILDEVQNAPDVLPWVKREIDQADAAGSRACRFLLTGSQQFALMKGVSESLAGRVAIVDLWPFASQERQVQPRDIREFLDALTAPNGLAPFLGRRYPATDWADVAPAMLAGGYAPVCLADGGFEWLDGYRQTYLHRDVRDLRQVADLGRFDRFLVLMAARSGSIVNKSELGSTLGLDDKTVDAWMSVLVTSYLGFALPAFSGNVTKRLARRPKWVLADSALGLCLQGVRAPDILLSLPHFGGLFEAFVVAELRKLYGHAHRSFPGSHWRTQAGAECDLVLDSAGRPVPIEVKHAATLTRRDTTGLTTFVADHPEAPHGVLISLNDRVERLTPTVWNLPLGALLRGL